MHATTFYCIELEPSRRGDVYRGRLVKRQAEAPPETIYLSRWHRNLSLAIAECREHCSLSARPQGKVCAA